MSRAAKSDPVCLLIPGIDGSGAGHWQTHWADDGAHFRRVDLGCWQAPDKEQWIERLDEAIAGEDGRPIILVAHSLGCLLVAWWAERFPVKAAGVAGAMLVAPCDVDLSYDQRLRRYAPMPAQPLPFPTILVASTNDPHAPIASSAALADRLDADLLEIGPLGHINAATRLGRWDQGLRLLDLVRNERRRHPAARRTG